MSALDPVFAVGALAVALLTALVISRLSPPATPKRFTAIEGLRGLLALLVVLDHVSGWRLQFRPGGPPAVASRLFTHFGESSVAMFFMITAFLFTTKLLDARGQSLDWRRLYVSRALRLVPLYVVFVALLVLLAFVDSHFTLRVSAPRLALQTAHWLGFTVADMPNLNRFSSDLYGGAAWSLPYEWCFYFVLPAAGLLLSVRSSWPVTLAGMAAVAAGAVWVTARGGWLVVVPFLGGLLAAALVRNARAKSLAAHPAAALLALATYAAVLRMPIGFDLRATAMLALAFAIVACGNTLFGALTSAPARTLGEMGYSVYLLHGLFLYGVFAIVGVDRIGRLTTAQYWTIVLAAMPVLIGLCHATFRLIEAPGVRSVDRVVHVLKGRRPAPVFSAPPAGLGR